MQEETLKTKRIFSGKIVTLERVDVRLEDGRISFREIVRHPGAVAVLVRHIDGHFILVDQFRKPVEAPVREIVAGTLEPGEDPEDCARRELKEETGFEADRMESLGDLFLTPGYSSERIHLYFAEVSGEPSENNLDEDECVETVCMSEGDFICNIQSSEILDAKTIAAYARYTLCPRGADRG